MSPACGGPPDWSQWVMMSSGKSSIVLKVSFSGRHRESPELHWEHASLHCPVQGGSAQIRLSIVLFFSPSLRQTAMRWCSHVTHSTFLTMTPISAPRGALSTPRQTPPQSESEEKDNWEVQMFTHNFSSFCKRQGPDINFPVLAMSGLKVWYVNDKGFEGKFSCVVSFKIYNPSKLIFPLFRPFAVNLSRELSSSETLS